MFHISILTVGRLKESYLSAGVQEYLKRLSSYAKVTLVEVADERVPETVSNAQYRKVREKEASRLLPRIPRDAFLIALDENGVRRNSVEMARLLDAVALTGKNEIAFLVGGSLGLAKDLLQRADLQLSFSALTFPHQLFRLILLEQLYRWFKISRAEPYHH